VAAWAASLGRPAVDRAFELFPLALQGKTVLIKPNVLRAATAAEGITTHPAVDMVAFTGASPVGAQSMAQAAATMKRIQLELGGKSAAIYLPDSVDTATMGAVTVCVAHAGQGCALGTRIMVPEGAKPQVLEAMAAAVAKIRQGHASDPDTQMGPVVGTIDARESGTGPSRPPCE
jgi:acyl-CoA reductase-like NAD-dependent aldehyde dehydrogenase